MNLMMFAGTWYEVLSIKQGFAGLGQGDCVDTKGVYEYVQSRDELDVVTSCRHFDGHKSGIKGIVTCPKVGRTCSLRFPTAPFVPPSKYKVLETDYDTYAIVESGLGPRSAAPFVQVYSRKPHPGLKFINAKSDRLRQWGYDPTQAHMTPVTYRSESQ